MREARTVKFGCESWFAFEALGCSEAVVSVLRVLEAESFPLKGSRYSTARYGTRPPTTIPYMVFQP